MAYNLEFEIVIAIPSQLIRTAILSRRKNTNHDYFTVIVNLTMSKALTKNSTNKNSMGEYGKGLVLLHGTLEISIDEAQDLPDMESKNY